MLIEDTMATSSSYSTEKEEQYNQPCQLSIDHNDHRPKLLCQMNHRRIRNGRTTTTTTIGRSAFFPSFAAALLLASVQQHRVRGGLFNFYAYALEDLAEFPISPTNNNGADTDTTRTRRRTRGDNPFLPDYITASCKNDKPADAWMTDPPGTAGECCKRHFSWAESECGVMTQQWLGGSDISGGVGGGGGGAFGDFTNGGGGGGDDVVEYYPDSNMFKCKVVTALTPSWITSREYDYEDCCTKWFKWNLADCLDASPLTPVGGVMVNTMSDVGSSSSGNGGNINNNNNKPANTITTNDRASPTAWPTTPFPTDGGENCDGLSKKNCKRISYCSWMEDDDFCASPFTVNAEGYSNYCSGRERDDCEKEERCKFHKKKGCLAMVSTSGGDSDSSNGGDGETPGGSNGDVNSDNTENTSCQSLAYGECASRSDVCRWSTRTNNCTDNANSSSNANKVDNSPDCVSFDRGKCDAHLDDCMWRKKRGCLPSTASTSNNIINNDSSSNGDNAPRTGNPTPSPTPSPTKMQWYYDTGDGMCKPDGKDRPDWIRTVYDDYEECCENSWDSAECTDEVMGDGNSAVPKPNGSDMNNNSPDCASFNWSECVTRQKDECIWRKNMGCVPSSSNSNNNDASNNGNNTPRTGNPTPSPTPSPTKTQWYYDTGDGMCKPVDKDRPEWIRTVYDDYDECCDNSWDDAKCVNEVMEMMKEDADTGDGNGEDDGEETKKYYYDSGDGMCKPDGKKRPKWLTTLYEGFEECCDLSWAMPSCLRSKHNPDKNKDSSGDDVDNNDGEDISNMAPIFIELTVRGSMDLLNMEELPLQTDRDWNRLKRVLTKSITMIMSEFSQMIHSEHMEVDLGSIDGVVFNWRRERRLDEDGQEDGGIEEDAQDDMDVKEDVEETTPTSSLRGGNLVVLQQQQHERRLVTSRELKFELTVLAKCDGQCQSDTLVALGTSPLKAINTYYQTVVSNGSFAVMLKKEGNAMGLFRKGAPSASNGKLTYVYAEKSTRGVDEGLTWAPTPRTTPSPRDTTGAPTLDMYYPQTEDAVCKSGDGHSDTNVYFYGTIEECCKFPWMGDYKVCMYNSKLASRPSWRPTIGPTPPPVRTKRPKTKRPSRGDSSPTNVEAKPPKTKRPTKKPTKAPKTKRPTKKPTKAPKPTKMPIGQNSSPTGPGRPNTPTSPTRPGPNPVENPTGNGAVVYYPDLNLGVCKFDGSHGNNPYQFPTAAACCTNRWMDYDKCMAYADPYLIPPKYYPDIYAGYCKSDGGDVGLDEQLVFDGAEECCDNVWMVYAECLVKSLSGTPPSVANPTGPVAPTDPGPLNDPNPPTTVPTTPDPSPYPTMDPTYATPDPSRYPTYHPSQGIVVPRYVTGEFYRDFHAGLCLPEFGQVFTFDTLEDCCTSNALDYEDCLTLSLEHYDNLPPSCMWYPDPALFGTCTYGSSYPESWARAEKRDMYLFDDHENCCVSAYGGPGCAQNYWCNGANFGPTPTVYVSQPPTTDYPTFYPTKPEPRLTPKPTSRPTTKPTGPTITRRPTKQPTVFVTPPGITTAIDVASSSKELFDGFENGLTGGFPWHTSPNSPWTTSDWDKTEGRYSARSHIGIQAGEQSDLSVAFKSDRGGLLTFDFKSDVKMPHHGCYINLDGVTVKGYTFMTGWMSLQLKIPAGDSVVTFRAWSPNFGPPPHLSDGSGTVGLDNVGFKPNA